MLHRLSIIMIYFWILGSIKVCYFQCSFGGSDVLGDHWILVENGHMMGCHWIYRKSIIVEKWSNVSIGVPIACLSQLTFVTQGRIFKHFMSTVIPTQTDLLPKNHSCISIFAKRKEILCWNVQAKHNKGSPANELWTILHDTIQHNMNLLEYTDFSITCELYGHLQLTEINSFFPISILSHSLLHISGQCSYKFDSQYISKDYMGFQDLFWTHFYCSFIPSSVGSKMVSCTLKDPNKANNQKLINTQPSIQLSIYPLKNTSEYE